MLKIKALELSHPEIAKLQLLALRGLFRYFYNPNQRITIRFLSIWRAL